MIEYEVIRYISMEEADWLPAHLRDPGARVFEYRGPTYGCIDWSHGFPVSEIPGETPFYEIPFDAVMEIV